MQEFKNATMRTELQQFILDVVQYKTKIQKVDLTFFGLIPDDYDEDVFESIDDYNQFFLEKFYQGVYGKEDDEFNSEVYQKVTLSDITLFTKQFEHGKRSIRMVFIPCEQYDLLDDENDDKGPKAYIKMVKKFYFSNLFMKQSATNQVKLIAMDFVPKPASGVRGKPKGISIVEHVTKLFEKLQKNFSIGSQTQLSKMTFLFPIQERKDLLVFKSADSKDININGQILLLTNDDKMHPVYRLLQKGQAFKLDKEEVILSETNNVVTTKNFHHFFHYNAFVNYKPKWAKNNILDQITTDELWGVIETIIYPLFVAKQMISDVYQLPQEEGQTKKIIETIEKEKWSNVKSMKNDFAQFNELFGELQWIESQRGIVAINDGEDQIDCHENQNMYQIYSISKKQTSTPTHQQNHQYKLFQYTRHFKLYSRFLKQQPNFIHAMILDHINSLHKDISETADEIHKATGIDQQMETQNKLLSWTKAIVRFLAQLKKHQKFSNLLQSYNPEFYEYILETYLSAYAEFCSANKQIYGKMFDLSQKLGSLKSTKKQILKVVKSVNSFTQLYKDHKFKGTLQELDDKRLLLEIMFRLLKENKSQEKDKEIDTKIMNTQYDLGGTYYKIALLQQYGHTQSGQLQKALKILYNDLYLKLFIDRKDFEKEFSKNVNFSELELLQKVSGLLKLLDHIDLAIEIEKKLDNITTVENYFNRWMMKYHRLHGAQDQKKIVEICQKAIQYFSIKFEVSKVIHFYDLLIKNSLTFQEKSEWRDKRFRYLNCSRDADWCKKGMDKAEKTLFPITKEISDRIVGVLKSQAARN